ncbi:hypothetical protein GCM10010121_003030 [Streptomyces brasiliensis]|uniref:Secreted protein n=2 Tax=Streptomyces brasiliensis TaxID=1954 RepID=A0A917NF20_9ACTN|nr:hypothetical protein GCM10010121_003030 [Streptomyces brasiliensis]
MIWAGVLFAGVTTTASAGPSASVPDARERVSTTPVLVDCFWHSTVRPDDFILACADGNSRLTGLQWSQWGKNSAIAEGVNVVNDCKPYCAAGKFHPYNVTVRLDGPKPWEKNPQMDHFTRMSLTFHGARPEGFKQVMTYSLWD